MNQIYNIKMRIARMHNAGDFLRINIIFAH